MDKMAAQIAFEAYGEALGLPPLAGEWENIRREIQNAWHAAVNAAQRAIAEEAREGAPVTGSGGLALPRIGAGNGE